MESTPVQATTLVQFNLSDGEKITLLSTANRGHFWSFETYRLRCFSSKRQHILRHRSSTKRLVEEVDFWTHVAARHAAAAKLKRQSVDALDMFCAKPAHCFSFRFARLRR